MNLKICVAQLNLCVGDLAGNARKIIEAAQQAYSDGARLLLTPELSICGYAAEDLFLRPAFIAACDDAVKTVAQALTGLKGLAVVVGHPVGGDSRTRSVAIQPVTRASSTSSGRLPPPSTTSWKPRRSKAAPRSRVARFRSVTSITVPT
jgi:NAD+ synthase (glutamine-hydrolysing)